jgi:hypothetical protein
MKRLQQQWYRTVRSVLPAFVVCALALSAGSSRAGETSGRRVMTGNLRVDLFGVRDLRPGPEIQQEAVPMAMPSRRSPWLAAGMSALIPGSGQIYTGSYWEAALFLAVDVAALFVAYKYDEKGDRQTDYFQDFANGHWSVVKYAQYAQTLTAPGKVYNWRKSGTESMDPFDRPWTQVNWDEINRMERDIAGYYSHTLPAYNEQQYYELIGKYPQFNQGWNDATASFNYGDPLTPNFLWYSGERGKANSYYATATSWMTVVLVNHLLSAADGAWSAIRYNRAQASASMRIVPVGDHYAFVGMATVRIKM